MLQRVVLIDEPEAFLHPPLARRLANALSMVAEQQYLNIVVATHSSDFLMGCVETGTPVDIVRLEYNGSVGRAKHLPAAELRTLMTDPLLRSNDLLRAPFCETAVISESDADRAFYAEVNFRLQAQAQPEGIPACLFLHAQNKQTVKRLLEPLRKLGVPTAVIVDIDVIKEGGTVWSSLLRAAGVPAAMHSGLGAIRAAVNAAFEASAGSMKVDGPAALDQSNAEAFLNLCNQLERYGIFVVPVGELECWLRSLGVTGKSPKWVVEIFEKLGAIPGTEGYVTPASGDVWDFLRGLARWLSDSARLGMNP